MKNFFYTSIIIIFILLVHGRDSMVATQEKIKFYQLTYQMNNIKGMILINGFVLKEMKGKSGSGSDILNTWLVGDNEVKAELEKADPAISANFSIGVSELERGSIVSTTDKGTLFSIEIKNEDFGKDGKATIIKKFKSILDFSRHLSDAGETSESNVIAYARKYYNLFVKKDAEGIIRESLIRISDYSKAFGGIDMKVEMRKYLMDEVFKAKLNKLNPSSMHAVAVGPTKKIWHVFNGKDELIKAKSSDSSTLEMSVYIGLLNGKLKVVR